MIMDPVHLSGSSAPGSLPRTFQPIASEPAAAAPTSAPASAPANTPVMEAVGLLTRLLAESDEIWGKDPCLAEDDPYQTAWRVAADHSSDLVRMSLQRVTALPVTTPADVAAIAGVIPALSAFNDHAKGWPELALVHKLAADVVRVAQQQSLGASPEVLDVVRRTRAALERVHLATTARDALADALPNAAPVPPETLFRTDGDFEHFRVFVGRPYRHHVFTSDAELVGRQWYGEPDNIRELTMEGDAIVDKPAWHNDAEEVIREPVPNPAGRERVATILRAHSEWFAAIMAWKEGVGLAAAEREWEAACAAMRDLFPEVAKAPARTFGDFLAKGSLCADSVTEWRDLTSTMAADCTGVEMIERSIALGLAGLVYEAGRTAEFGPASKWERFAQFAAQDFEPWPMEKSRPLDNEQWRREFATDGPHATMGRFAWKILTKTRPELIEAVRAMDAEGPDIVRELYDGLKHTTEVLDCLRCYTDTAAERLLSTSAAVALQQGDGATDTREQAA